MMFLLYFSVSFYGLNVGRSVVEEKTSRIFEVLLSSVKAESLMIGKLLGVGAAALTQLGIWFALVAFYAGSQMAAKAGIHGVASLGIQPIQVVFFLIYFCARLPLLQLAERWPRCHHVDGAGDEPVPGIDYAAVDSCLHAFQLCTR